MTKREEFSAKTRRAANERAGVCCEWVENGFRCQSVLGPGNREFDHIVPFAISQDSSLENCMVLCRAHHRLKTDMQDQGWIAKTRRQRDGHNGAKVSKGPPLQSRNTLSRGRKDRPPKSPKILPYVNLYRG